MEDRQFDDLARKLAKPISRRQVLKAMVATIEGGALLRSGSGEAFAGNSGYARFCNDTLPAGLRHNLPDGSL